jgi:hypothetical protein
MSITAKFDPMISDHIWGIYHSLENINQPMGYSMLMYMHDSACIPTGVSQ